MLALPVVFWAISHTSTMAADSRLLSAAMYTNTVHWGASDSQDSLVVLKTHHFWELQMSVVHASPSSQTTTSPGMHWKLLH